MPANFQNRKADGGMEPAQYQPECSHFLFIQDGMLAKIQTRKTDSGVDPAQCQPECSHYLLPAFCLYKPESSSLLLIYSAECPRNLKIVGRNARDLLNIMWNICRAKCSRCFFVCGCAVICCVFIVQFVCFSMRFFEKCDANRRRIGECLFWGVPSATWRSPVPSR